MSQRLIDKQVRKPNKKMEIKESPTQQNTKLTGGNYLYFTFLYASA